MQFTALTDSLTHFTTAFAAAYDRLMPIRNHLLGTLLIIAIVLTGIWFALGMGDQLGNVIKKILFYGTWIWLSTSFGTLAKAFVESLIQAGLIAGGNPGNARLLLDPSRIASYGLTLTEPLMSSMEGMDAFDFSDMLIYSLAYLALIVSYFIMALQVFLSVLEYYLLMAVASVLLPFAVLEPTKFLAEKAIGAVVSAGIKLMVLAFIIGIVEPTLRSIHFAGTEVTLNELMSVLCTSFAIALLTWKAPSLAAGLLAGSPSLSAGAAAAGAVGAAYAGAALATGGAGAVAGALNATKKAAGAAMSGARKVGSMLSGSAGAAASASGAANAAVGGGAAAAAGGGAGSSATSAAGAASGSGGTTAAASDGEPSFEAQSPGAGARGMAAVLEAVGSRGAAGPSPTAGGGAKTVSDGPPTIASQGGAPTRTSIPAPGARPGGADTQVDPPRSSGTATAGASTTAAEPPAWATETLGTLRGASYASHAADAPTSRD